MEVLGSNSIRDFSYHKFFFVFLSLLRCLALLKHVTVMKSLARWIQHNPSSWHSAGKQRHCNIQSSAKVRKRVCWHCTKCQLKSVVWFHFSLTLNYRLPSAKIIKKRKPKLLVFKSGFHSTQVQVLHTVPYKPEYEAAPYFSNEKIRKKVFLAKLNIHLVLRDLSKKEVKTML
jgi:hypothetical protein